MRLHNDSESGCVTKKLFGEELGINDMSGVRVEEEQGNFWSSELYKTHFNQDPPPSGKHTRGWRTMGGSWSASCCLLVLVGSLVF